MKKEYQKKIKLGVAQKHTKWAPLWAIIRAFGKGKRKHPSELTVYRRHRNISRLKIKPRRLPKTHLG